MPGVLFRRSRSGSAPRTCFGSVRFASFDRGCQLPGLFGCRFRQGRDVCRVDVTDAPCCPSAVVPQRDAAERAGGPRQVVLRRAPSPVDLGCLDAVPRPARHACGDPFDVDLGGPCPDEDGVDLVPESLRPFHDPGPRCAPIRNSCGLAPAALPDHVDQWRNNHDSGARRRRLRAARRRCGSARGHRRSIAPLRRSNSVASKPLPQILAHRGAHEVVILETRQRRRDPATATWPQPVLANLATAYRRKRRPHRTRGQSSCSSGSRSVSSVSARQLTERHHGVIVRQHSQLSGERRRVILDRQSDLVEFPRSATRSSSSAA